MATVDLTPKYFAKTTGEAVAEIPDTLQAKIDSAGYWYDESYMFDKQLTEDQIPEASRLLREMHQTKIKIAEFAESTFLKSEGDYDYIKAEVGMNIIIPTGYINELRFNASLIPSGDVVAIDGFPDDKIEYYPIVGGSVSLGIDELFKFLPPGVPNPTKLLNIKLNPWNFQIGNLKKVRIDFGGALTDKLEWYITEGSIGNGSNARFAFTIKKPKNVNEINADIKAIWSYSSGFIDKIFRYRVVQSDVKRIKIFQRAGQ